MRLAAALGGGLAERLAAFLVYHREAFRMEYTAMAAFLTGTLAFSLAVTHSGAYVHE